MSSSHICSSQTAFGSAHRRCQGCLSEAGRRSLQRGRLADLPFSEASFGLAIVNHVLNDLPDIAAPVGELARVLRPGGRLVILMLHPCFYGDRAERRAIRRSLPVADYFAPRVIEQRFEVDGIGPGCAVIPADPCTHAGRSTGRQAW